MSVSCKAGQRREKKNGGRDRVKNVRKKGGNQLSVCVCVCVCVCVSARMCFMGRTRS